MANQAATRPVVSPRQPVPDREREDRVTESLRAGAGLPRTEDTATGPLAGASAGALAGAAIGTFAGPVGAIAGGVIGAVAGTAVGLAMGEQAHVDALVERELDDAIGVTKGDLGAAPPDAPPSRTGAFSLSSAGLGGTGGSVGPADAVPDEGPIPKSE